MREIRLSGSVRGVRRKPYPYRDRPKSDAVGSVALRQTSHERRTELQTPASRPKGRPAA